MKRFWALILTLALVLQVAVAGVAFSEETPTVTLTITDAEGNTKEVILDDTNTPYREDGVYAENNLPDGGVIAGVYSEDETTLSVNIDGDMVLVDEDHIVSNALTVGNQTDASVNGIFRH